MSQWIDFKALRERLNFAEVLKHYGINPKRVIGNQFHAICPLKEHGGERRSATFSANLSRGIWQCFSCGARGNVLDLAVRMEGLSPDKTADVRTTALRLQKLFRIDGVVSERGPERIGSARKACSQNTPHDRNPLFDLSAKAATPTTSTVKVNEPLDFDLKGLQPNHPFLTSKGILPETIRHFGLGFASRGLMAGRIVIPLHDERGRLVGYCGRTVDDSAIGPKHPKYLLPSRRQHEGITYEFDASRLLYNTHRIKGPVDHLVVVEWFPAVWWLHQAGMENVVALMGSHCTPAQAEMILANTARDARISALPDATESASGCAHSIFAAVGRERWTQWIRLPGQQSPTDCRPDKLHYYLR